MYITTMTHLVLVRKRGERDDMVDVGDGLQLHEGVLDVAERHLAVGEVVKDAAEAPDVRLVADLDAGLLVARAVILGTV